MQTSFVAFLAAPRFKALRAAADRGIPAVFEAEKAGCTRVRVGSQHRATVDHWFRMSAQGPEPDGVRCTGMGDDE